MNLRWLAGLLLIGLLGAQQGQDLLASGRELLSRLTADAAANERILRAEGFDSAAAKLFAVMQHGMAADASARDWEEQHRAASALIDLEILRGNTGKASVWATMQNFFYRSNEQDYAAALKFSRKALELQPGMSVNWIGVGRDLLSLGETAEALKHFRRAQQLEPEPASAHAAQLWREIIHAELALKNTEAARQELEKFQHASLAASKRFQAEAMLSRADLAMAEARYMEALPSIKDAHRLMAGESDDSFPLELVNSLMSCVLASMSSLPYAEAIALAERMDTELPGLPFPVAPRARAAIQVRRRLAGDLEGVLRDDLQRLEKARASGEVGAQIEALHAMAASYAAANSRTQQIQVLEEVLELARPSAASYSYLWTLDLLGEAHADRGNMERARACYEEIERRIASLPARSQQLFGGIRADAALGEARVALLDRDPNRARDLLRREADGPRRADALLDWARLEKSAGQDPRETVKLYEAAIEAARGRHDRQREITVRLELARFLAAFPALPDARQQAAEHLRLVQEGARSLNYANAQWRVSFLQGLLAERTDRPAAIEHYRAAIDRLDRIRAGLSEAEQRQAFVDDEAVNELYQRMVAALTRGGRREEAWQYLERGKARAFLEMLRGRRFHTGASGPAARDLRQLEREIIDLRVRLNPRNQTPSESGRLITAAREAELQKLEARFTLVRQQAALEGSRAGHELSLRPPTLRQAQQALPPRTALLECALLPDAVSVFLITRQGVDQITWEVDLNELRANVVEARKLLGRPDSGEGWKPVVQDISVALMEPLRSKLPAAVDHLILVPADFLNYLPFEVLFLPDGSQLIDRYAISYLPNASALQYLKSAGNRPRHMFLGAIGGSISEGMPALPGTLRETESIARLYPRAVRVVEQAFTHDRLRAAFLQDDIVHVATHGVLDPQSPLFNALITSPAARQPSRFSLYELTAMSLRARLVVLSACDSGLGQLGKGDEITGLTRTFLQAGAATVVSSLWKVSDESTAAIMESFYRHLLSGRSPARALRQAVISVKKRSNHPYYWAPFVTSGLY